MFLFQVLNLAGEEQPNGCSLAQFRLHFHGTSHFLGKFLDDGQVKACTAYSLLSVTSEAHKGILKTF